MWRMLGRRQHPPPSKWVNVLMPRPTVFDPDFVDEFKSVARLRKQDPDRCWVWDAKSVELSTYPKYKTVEVHRLSQVAYNEQFTSDKPYALHSCHNKWCWNPKHLRAGNDQQNKEDQRKPKWVNGINPNTV